MSMITLRTRGLVRSMCLGLLVVVAGCSSSGEKAVSRSEQTVESIADFRNQVANASKQLDKTMASLDGVMNASGDRKKAFETYMKEVANLKEEGDEAKQRSDDLRERSKEYVAKWQQDVSTVSDPALKAQADARRAQIQDRIGAIQADARAAGDAYRPLMKELTDIQTVLANDLTAANVQGVAPVAAKAHQHAAELRKSLDAFVAELESLGGAIGPKGA